MSLNETLLEIRKQLGLIELPVGVYAVTREGQILEANKEARKILQLPPEGKIGKSILDYYVDPSERASLLTAHAQQEMATGYFKSRLKLRVGNKTLYVQDNARAIKNPQTGEVVAYLCCMMDVTSEERYRELFDVLPIGFYELDREDRIVKVNNAFAKLLGYETPQELQGRPIHEFYIEPDDAREFRELVERDGFRNDYPAQVKKENGDAIFVRINAVKLTSHTGEYEGREGTVMDAAKDRYERILEVAPIGLFEIESKNGMDKIVHCNDQFVTITEFDDKSLTSNFDVKELHVSNDDYQRFITDLENSSRAGRPLRNRELRIRTFKGNEKVVRVSVSVVRDRNQKIIGRIGVIRDDTELKHQVEELTVDIGNILHTFSAALVEIKQGSDGIIQSLRPDPFEGITNLLIETALEKLRPLAARLAHSLDLLLLTANMQSRHTPSLAGHIPNLTRLNELFTNYETVVPYPELHPPTLRQATYELADICDSLRGEKLPRELLKQIRAEGQDLLRVTNLLTLHQMRDLAFTMGHPVRALREFVLSGIRVKVPPSVVKAATLVSQAAGTVVEFAQSRKVQFRRKIECPEALVRVVERDVVRAIANILHNAIKYSWTRADSSTWVLIRVHLQDGFVHFVFENYGVPIPKEEIEMGLIFQLGFRGNKSGDRGRIGTGIGLTDAWRVAAEHEGTVKIKSYPAVASRRDDDYTQPFLTVVDLSLPAYTPKGATTNEA
jgi:PAS domain S-box-containing protein